MSEGLEQVVLKVRLTQKGLLTWTCVGYFTIIHTCMLNIIYLHLHNDFRVGSKVAASSRMTVPDPGNKDDFCRSFSIPETTVESLMAAEYGAASV